MIERRVIPRSVKDAIKRMVEQLPDPVENDGMVTTLIGTGFSGDLVAKNGKWKTKDKCFRVKIVPESEDY